MKLGRGSNRLAALQKLASSPTLPPAEGGEPRPSAEDRSEAAREGAGARGELEMHLPTLSKMSDARSSSHFRLIAAPLYPFVIRPMCNLSSIKWRVSKQHDSAELQRVVDCLASATHDKVQDYARHAERGVFVLRKLTPASHEGGVQRGSCVAARRSTVSLMRAALRRRLSAVTACPSNSSVASISSAR